MQWLASLSVRRAVFAAVINIVVIVVGIVGYMGLGVDKFPNIDIPTLTITTVYPGASPSAVETDVTETIEAAVNAVAGLDTLTSTSSEGVSVVIASFTLETSVDVAAQDIRDRVETVLDELPDGVEAPQVQKIDPDAVPILTLSVQGDVPIAELTKIADDDVRRRLETISGVGQVDIIGGRERRVEVELDPIRMRSAKIGATEVQMAIARANADTPGGTLEFGATAENVRVVGRAANAEQIGAIVVRQLGDRPVFLRDIADVHDGIEDAESAAYRDGESTVALTLRKQSGGNTIEVVYAAREVVEALASELPPGVSLEIVRDNSESTRTSIDSVLEHLLVGGMLAALIVLLFLGDLRSTIISAISIPISVIGTFALMSILGFTLNMMTLLALALSVGIVIDDAIVVIENIHRFIHEKGMKPFPAAIAATEEIGLAVLATSLSLMAVFLPVAFMDGMVGRFLLSFGVTMACAIAVSVVVSFTVVPMLSARLLPPEDAAHKPGPVSRFVDACYRPVERAYMAMLRFALRRRWVIVLACIASMLAVGPLAKAAGFGFMPVNDDAQFELYVEAPSDTTIEGTALISERIARETRSIPGVAYTLATIADNTQKQANVARIYVRLVDPAEREVSQEQLMNQARELLAGKVPEGVTVAVQTVSDFGSGQTQGVQFALVGPDLERLDGYAREAIAQLAEVPGVVDPQANIDPPIPELRLRPDLDRAAALGVSPGDISSSLSLLVGGANVSKYLAEDGEQYDVFVRASEDVRLDENLLSLLTVPSQTVGQVPLSDVVDVDRGLGPSVINRLSRERQITIGANVAPGAAQGAIITALQEIIADLDMPAGYKAVPLGQTKELEKMGQAFVLAFLLAFVFMYLVLAAQFDSWLHPLTILLALPLTLPFAFASVVLFGQQLNLFSILGLLVLFGVVKKNSILQIDQANQLREQGMERREAILTANHQRLRPILMTTIAFVAGMLPMVFSHGIGSGLSRAMATIVVGGQTLSLLLTLLAIPVIYSIFDDAARLFARIAEKRGTAVDRGRAEVMLPIVLAMVLVPSVALAAPPSELPGEVQGEQLHEGQAGVDTDGSEPFPEPDYASTEDSLPFAAESLQLSEVIAAALTENYEYRAQLIEVEISEADILTALGAFDVTLTAGFGVEVQKSVPRGSAFVFSTGSREFSGYLGVSRRLESGGTIALRFDMSRTTTDQPISFLDLSLGSAPLDQYLIRPTLSFSHPLLRGVGVKVNRAPIEQAKIARSIAEAEQLSTAQVLVDDLVSAYWDTLYAERDLANKRRAVELSRRQLADTSAKVETGQLPAIEAQAVEQGLAQREAEVIVAENRLLDAGLRLRTSMGQRYEPGRPLGVIPTTAPDEFAVEPVDVDATIETAMANDPRVRQLQLAVASRRIDETVAARDRLPQLDFTASFSPQGRSVDTFADAQEGTAAIDGSWGEAFGNFISDDVSEDGLFAEYTVSGALDFSWAIQNRTARGRHQRAAAQLRLAEQDLEQLRMNTASAVVSATNELRSASKRLELGHLSLALAEQNLELERARFELGQATNYDVLLRIDDVADADTAILQAQLDYLRARLELQRLTGEILPAYGLDLAGSPA
ncbi:efflux RND transporter permease subunit [Pseudenhygromyxa sp. WMMC2535]|uniref:efflux RND transporter permease subunit n=1 Tax=Pseudenhygromyxa sp. WMMC2535 TaxID=2712867 RepID=UPI0015958DB6|nr:efflux RND transporter permease subunit [Pseudenhygromyxa sp. WMMC2535]NVB36561.1 efflux RND transporter permease subunit [Pseudenhygromyxa sp. WMMC2535]